MQALRLLLKILEIFAEKLNVIVTSSVIISEFILFQVFGFEQHIGNPLFRFNFDHRQRESDHVNQMIWIALVVARKLETVARISRTKLILDVLHHIL